MIPHKLFISYSHKDEEIVDELKKHLSGLRRNNAIDDWHDRKILAGGEWKGEIDSHLEEASVILFIVSSDFLASDYCYEIEAKTAIEQHESKSSVVIPIIVRSCDWTETPFAKLQAAPTDAKPMSEWPTHDEFYLDVTNKIKKTLREHPRLQKPTQSSLGENLLKKTFLDYLNDTEIVFSHRNSDKVSLDDIFVTPDLQLLSENFDKKTRSIAGIALVDESTDYVVLGDEQSGKTTLAKRLILEFLSTGVEPLLIQGKGLAVFNLDKAIQRAKEAQYHDPKSHPATRVNSVLIIDDFCKAKSSKGDLQKIVEKAKEEFARIIIFAEEAFEFIVRENILGDFSLSKILHFSNQRRAELAEKWTTIGADETEQNEKYYNDIDKLRRHLDQFIVKNSVPSRPVILVSLLQSAETIAPTRSELTNYGHCYQYIIHQALDRANIAPSVVDSCFNYLTELAGLLRLSKQRRASISDLKLFKESYRKRFIGGDIDEIEKALIGASILKVEDEAISFKYRYFLYFFAGKYVADGLASGRLERYEIAELTKRLHREESSNILLYITHHTKLPWVIEDIQYCLLELFDTERAATLSCESLAYIQDFVNGLPELVIEQRDLVHERKIEYEKRDNLELAERKRDGEVEEAPPDNFLATVNRLFKGIELTGQIVRNKYGSLEREIIKSLIRESYEATFRFLNYFIETTEAIKSEVIDCLEWMISQDEKFDAEVVEKKAKDLFIKLNYYLIFGTIVRIAESVGTQAAIEICHELNEEIDSPAINLVTITMELQFLKKIDHKMISTVFQKNDNNPVVQRILKEIVVRHTYLHPVDYRVQQKLAAALDIPSKKMQFSRSGGKLRLS